MKYFYLFVLGLGAIMASGQEYGAQWVIGPNTSVLDFRSSDSIHLYTISTSMNTTFTNADICDESGNLRYYTNGIYINDRNGNLLENGDSLSPCLFTDEYETEGLIIRQAALFIPKPSDARYDYLFHFSYDTLNNTRPGTLYYSIIDNAGNSGLGAVIQKNIIFCKGEFRGGGMTACKHANGRDWWVVLGGSNNNKFYKFLVTPDSIMGPFIQSIGPVYYYGNDQAYGKFSQDGTKYVTGAVEGYVLVLDFDRCNGELSNPITIFNEASSNPVKNSVTGSVAEEFSPNNRFVYVSNVINLNQYDLLSENIQDSVEIYRADTVEISGIDFIQLAPDGKVYATSWDGGFYFLHVINYPDEKGDSCGFVYGGQPTLSNNSINLPNIVNYKLGPLVGSGCDTIITGTSQPAEAIKQIRIQPNPADKYAYVEMPMQGNYELDLLNSIGQLIAKKQTPQIDIFDTEALPAGIYFIIATDRQTGKQVATQRVGVVH